MKTILMFILACCCVNVNAQQQVIPRDSTGTFKKSRSSFRDEFEQFRQQLKEDFEDYRHTVNKEFIEFVKNPWKSFELNEPVKEQKDEESVPPIHIPDQDKLRPIESIPVKIEGVIKPITISPQPLPVVPIKEIPLVDGGRKISFQFFGTTETVRFDMQERIVLRVLEEKQVAKALEKLATSACDNLILDCLDIRERRGLCDWAYLQMLQSMSESVYGQGTNEAILLMAYVYMQSGYKMRLARDEAKLFMLFACRHIINGKPFILIEGENYYSLEELPRRLQACMAQFPNEQDLSLLISQANDFEFVPCEGRSFRSSKFSQMTARITTNKNLLSFYETYPVSYYADDIMTRWAILANTPLQKEVRESFQKQLGRKIASMEQCDAVEHLLNWVQTGFEYKSDDEVWGRDRAFFSEETLYYPYNDCEDRAILFTRLVRDLLGLKCILIYYPGHLACAVHFDKTIPGDYVELDNIPYVICDPTYIGAPVGKEMPVMRDKDAKVILLE